MKTQARVKLPILLIIFMLFGGMVFDKYLNPNGWSIENVTLTDKMTGTYVAVNNP